MPNKCETCGREFYSDTEFEQHLQYHEFMGDLKEITESNARLFGGLMGEIEILTLALIWTQENDMGKAQEICQQIRKTHAEGVEAENKKRGETNGKGQFLET